jgi:hypothetical protein
MIERVREDISDTAGNVRKEMSALAWLLRTAVFAAVAGAVYKELHKPPEERTWTGKLLGFVPYDFRIPNVGRLRDAYWNPGSRQIFTDRPVGVGWAVNVAAVLKRLGIMGQTAQRAPRSRKS